MVSRASSEGAADQVCGISKAEVVHRIEQMDTILSILEIHQASELRELEETEEAVR
jgi:hypothetical protein